MVFVYASHEHVESHLVDIFNRLRVISFIYHEFLPYLEENCGRETNTGHNHYYSKLDLPHYFPYFEKLVESRYFELLGDDIGKSEIGLRLQSALIVVIHGSCLQFS